MVNHIAKTTLFVSQVTEVEVVYVVWDWKDLIVLCVRYNLWINKINPSFEKYLWL